MRYAIFDMDGTLVDSMSHWRKVVENFTASLNLGITQEEVEMLKGRNWIAKLTDLLNEKYNYDTTSEKLRSSVSAFMRKKYQEEVELLDTSRQLLDNFKASGVKMCVCSATDFEMMELMLKRLDLEKYFEFTVHCRAFGKEKDEKDIFIHCMKRLGAKSPEEVAVFEDALYSAKTARDNGFYVVGINDPTELDQETLKKVAHQYVNNYSELNYDLLPK